jgi:hypothetical protein
MAKEIKIKAITIDGNGRLPLGFKIGNQKVKSFISSDSIGDRYSIFFGTTNRLYDINISRGGPFEFSYEDYENILKRCSSLDHPCLISYYACGDDDGIIWLRSEHVKGASFFETEIVEEVTESDGEEETEICFPTLAMLLKASNGKIAAKDGCIIIGDLIEAVAFLHANSAYAADINQKTIFLDTVRRHHTLIARLRFYNWPKKADAELIRKDLEQVGKLIELLVSEKGYGYGSQLKRNLLQLSSDMQASADGFTGADFLERSNLILKQGGKPRVNRKKDDTVASPEPEVENKVPVRSESSHSKRRNKSRSSRQGSNVVRRRRSSSKSRKKNKYASLSTERGKQVLAVLVMLSLFILIVGIAFGVHAGLRYLEQRRHIMASLNQPGSYSSISIMEDEVDRVSGSKRRSIEELTTSELLTAAAGGDCVAAARLCIEKMFKVPGDLNALLQARETLKPLSSELKARAEGESSAAYWRACAILTGVLDDDSASAIENLEFAATLEHRLAMDALGDLLAANPERPDPVNDRRALSLWLKAEEKISNSSETELLADKIMFFVRQGRGFNKGDLTPIEFVRKIASAGNPKAALLLADVYEEGSLLEQSLPTTLSWLRNVAGNLNAPARLRSEAQRRMAEMFAGGRGTPPSQTAASTWYERAAELGDVKAMLALADILEKGDEGNGVRPEYAAAAEWRAKAGQATVLSETENVFPFVTIIRTYKKLSQKN